MERLFEMVRGYRNKAIAVLRLQAINRVVPKIQVLNREKRSLEKKIENNNSRIAEIESGAVTPSFSEVARHVTAARAKEKMIEDLNEENVSHQERVTSIEEKLSDLEQKVVDYGSGKNKFNREDITNLTARLLEQDGHNLSLEELVTASGVAEASKSEDQEDASDDPDGGNTDSDEDEDPFASEEEDRESESDEDESDDEDESES